MTDVTRILDSVNKGDRSAAGQLLPLVYGELRKLAAAKMAREKPGQTLQPTALVHEAWLRLGGDAQAQWNGRSHFFAAAAEAMRRILIEKARKKLAEKHGGQFEKITLSDSIAAIGEKQTELLRIDEVLDELTRVDSQSAEVVKCRFFLGMTNDESAEALGVSPRTVKRAWTFARAWLFDRLKATG